MLTKLLASFLPCGKGPEDQVYECVETWNLYPSVTNVFAGVLHSFNTFLEDFFQWGLPDS
jgi:hypothetical protein